MQLLDLDHGLDEKSEINMMSSFSRRGSASDSISLRSKLEMTKITKWTPPDQGVPAKSQQSESIWDWIEKNGEGDTFELKGHVPTTPE